MKIAYLILCHKNPKQVQMLVDKLNSDNADFYIHIDKKAKDFVLNDSDNVFVLSKESCVDVQWARKSMVIATMNLIHFMIDKGKKYDYIFLISGQDFPIKSNAEIEKYLTDNWGYNFIEVFSHSDKNYIKYKKRTDVYYPAWIQNSTTLAKIAKKLYIYLSGGYYKTFCLFKRKNSTDLNFEFGSQWWCLTYDCLKWITEYIDSHNEVLDFFDYSLTPDECLFQTVFMSSPFKEKRRNNLTYLEWSENKNNPRIFTENDYDLLIASDYLFARKFDINVAPHIIKLLEENND